MSLAAVCLAPFCSVLQGRRARVPCDAMATAGAESKGLEELIDEIEQTLNEDIEYLCRYTDSSFRSVSL